MKIKILSLNIWNYHNFKQRKPKIIELIKTYDPDIVVFQEVRFDKSKNKIHENQLKQINNKLGYKFSYFLPVQNFKDRKELDHDCIEGLAICSKYSFIKNNIPLKKHPDDIFKRKVLHIKFKFKNKVLNIFNVHFSPNDLFAKLHLKEVFRIQKNKKNTIIIGDFNYPHKKIISKLSKENGFKSSSDFDYISYPKDNCSYDYILISNNLKFEKFECINQIVSDHNALFSEIIL